MKFYKNIDNKLAIMTGIILVGEGVGAVLLYFIYYDILFSVFSIISIPAGVISLIIALKRDVSTKAKPKFIGPIIVSVNAGILALFQNSIAWGKLIITPAGIYISAISWSWAIIMIYFQFKLSKLREMTPNI